jgi:orotate phosphoribosyltransferase
MNSPRPTTKLSPFESNLLREKVFRLIKDKSFAKGEYVLASGKKSDYYLDMKPTMFDPEGLNALAEMVLHELQKLNVDYVGGLALGAMPLISSINLLSQRMGTPIPGFFVRKEVKDHGTKKLVEGLTENETLEGKTVVILDDVTTTGGSAMIAVDAAQEAGAKVILVLSVVDREEGAIELYGAKGIPFRALFLASEFMNS